MPDSIKIPLGLKIVAWSQIIIGSIATIWGIGIIIVVFSTPMALIFLPVIIFSTLLFTGIMLLRLRNWARILDVAVASFFLIVSLYYFVVIILIEKNTNLVALYLPFIFFFVYIIIYLTMPRIKKYFSHAPHIH